MRRLLELVLALAVSVGCSSSTIVIKESRTMAPGAFERLAVFVSLPAGGDRGIYHGFKKAMTSKLAACAIESSIVAGMPPKPDEEIPAQAASPRSDAQLIVRARYGQLTTVTTVDQHGIVHDEKAFKELELDLWFEVHDHNLKRVTWLAFAKLHMKDSGNVAGEKLAHTMVERLRSDGVLKRCR